MTYGFFVLPTLRRRETLMMFDKIGKVGMLVAMAPESDVDLTCVPLVSDLLLCGGQGV